jgi:phenylalanyl-tRNA synthetase beta chain
MEMGQPTHAFDLLRIPEGRIHVRMAREGERLTTLDGVERTLGPEAGVVAGPKDALALAGIMGGASSEVGESTTVVALEAAYWDPATIRRTAKGLGMHTEASHRFERGADPEAPRTATARIAHLLAKIGAGSTRPGLIEALGDARPRRQVTLRPARVDAVLGTTVPRERGRAILTGLGFEWSAAGEAAGAGATGAEAVAVSVPSWRGDVSRETCLVEEIGRHHGLEQIAPTVPPARLPGGLSRGQVRERRLRELLLGAGLSEAINFGLVDGAKASVIGDGTLGAGTGSAGSPAGAVALQNPLSSDLDVLRASLLPGLLGNLQQNQRQGRRDVALFEIGNVFAPALSGEALPGEDRRLAFVLCGALRPRHWSERPVAADFYTAKGLLETLAARLDVAGIAVSDATSLPAFLHPGRSSRVMAGDTRLGFAGVLHPDLRRQLDLREEIVVAEVAIGGWLAAEERPMRAASLDRFPPVLRDLSLLCDEALRAEDLLATVRAAGGSALRFVEIRDRYVGDPVPKGRVSLTVGLRFQEAGRTLTGEEVQKAVDEVTLALRSAGAEIRGEAGG